MIHGAIVSIWVAINSTHNTNVDIITGSLFSSLQFTDVLSANAYWLLTTWWLRQGFNNAGKLSTRGVYYSLPVILHHHLNVNFCIQLLKSVHFEKTDVRFLFHSKLWYFQYKSKKKYHNFER